MNTDMTKKFWNSKKIILDFKEAPVQTYWVDYFSSVKNKNKKSVLDLGCGGGRYTELLAKMGFKVYSLDLHIGMVNETKKRIEEIQGLFFKPIVVKSKMTSIPFFEKSFDIILSNGVYHNAKSFNELEIALEETKRVLKKDGILCVNMFYDGGNNSFLKKSKKTYMYKTKNNLLMVLLSLRNLLYLFKKHKFKKIGDIIFYTRDMDVGRRDVIRGIFKKI